CKPLRDVDTDRIPLQPTAIRWIPCRLAKFGQKLGPLIVAADLRADFQRKVGGRSPLAAGLSAGRRDLRPLRLAVGCPWPLSPLSAACPPAAARSPVDWRTAHYAATVASAAASSGRRMRKVVPRPSSVSKLSEPPCLSTMSLRAMARPWPEPRPRRSEEHTSE